MTYPIMNFPGNLVKAVTLSYDDGIEQDERLISILDEHKMKCTFNLNSGRFVEDGTTYAPGVYFRPLARSKAAALYGKGPHEVAIHGVHHPFLDRIPLPNAVDEVINDRRNLENMFGGVVRGCAYPYGTYNDNVVDVLRKCGIVYARHIASSCSFKIPTDWLRLAPTCHHNDKALPELTEKFLAPHRPNTEPWLFYLWGHTYEFETHDNWDVIEKFCDAVGGHDDIWYATNIEIYDYVTAFRGLLWNVGYDRVYNPSAIPVFFSVNGENYRVDPGQYLEIKYTK